MSQLDLKLDDEPFEIKKEDLVKGKEKLKFNINLKLIKKLDISTRITLVGILVSFLGSFLNFWGIKIKELGTFRNGNLFHGYGLGGVFGILFILSIIAIFLLTILQQHKFALIAGLVAIGAFLAQVGFILIWGKSSYPDLDVTTVYLGIGFYICLLGNIITTCFVFKNYKNNKEFV